MTLTGVIMVMTLISFDGTVSFGVIDYKNYDACFAGLKHDVDRSRYQYVDRVCMDDPNTINNLEKTSGKVARWGGLKSGWKD